MADRMDRFRLIKVAQILQAVQAFALGVCALAGVGRRQIAERDNQIASSGFCETTSAKPSFAFLFTPVV